MTEIINKPINNLLIAEESPSIAEQIGPIIMNSKMSPTDSINIGYVFKNLFLLALRATDSK